MQEEEWLILVTKADGCFNEGNIVGGIDAVNGIDVRSLPTVGPLERLPYHVISKFLCSWSMLAGPEIVLDIQPSLLKWLANQGANTCNGVPYISRHVANLIWSDTDLHETVRKAIELAIDLYTFDKEYSSAELTLILQSSRPEDRDKIYYLLDEKFAYLSYAQASYVFSFTNTVCVDWFVSRGRFSDTSNFSAAQYFIYLILCLSYCDETTVEMAIERLPQRQSASGEDKMLQAIRSSRQNGRNRPIKSGKLRVALCVAGQLRGYKTAQASWSMMGLSGHDVETFVHVWRDVGRKIPVPDHAWRSFNPRFASAFARYTAAVGSEEFWRRYPALADLFADTDYVTTEELCDFYRTKNVCVEDGFQMKFENNSERMYYKNYRVFQQMRAQGNFDLVIKIRPDKSLGTDSEPLHLSSIFDACMRDKVIYVDRSNFCLPAGGYSVGDQVAMGTQVDMEVYSSVWPMYKSRHLHERQPLPYGIPDTMLPHTNLAHVCLDKGILFRDLNNFGAVFSNLEDPEPLDDQVIRQSIQLSFPSCPSDLDLALLSALS